MRRVTKAVAMALAPLLLQGCGECRWGEAASCYSHGADEGEQECRQLGEQRHLAGPKAFEEGIKDGDGLGG